MVSRSQDEAASGRPRLPAERLDVVIDPLREAVQARADGAVAAQADGSPNQSGDLIVPSDLHEDGATTVTEARVPVVGEERISDHEFVRQEVEARKGPGSAGDGGGLLDS